MQGKCARIPAAPAAPACPPASRRGPKAECAPGGQWRVRREPEAEPAGTLVRQLPQRLQRTGAAKSWGQWLGLHPGSERSRGPEAGGQARGWERSARRSADGEEPHEAGQSADGRGPSSAERWAGERKQSWGRRPSEAQELRRAGCLSDEREGRWADSSDAGDLAQEAPAPQCQQESERRGQAAGREGPDSLPRPPAQSVQRTAHFARYRLRANGRRKS